MPSNSQHNIFTNLNMKEENTTQREKANNMEHIAQETQIKYAHGNNK